MQHGGNLQDAKALFPEAPEPWLDLSTGINPNPYPFQPPDLSAFARLPSPQEVGRIEAVAARAYGVGDPSRIVAAPGSQALIRMLPRLRAKSRVAIVGPTYSEHERSWTREGHDVIEVTGLAEGLVSAADVIVIANPNNPDGRVVGPSRLVEAAAALHGRGGWLVIDEAFADLEDGVSIAAHGHPGAVVLRSFGKAYGLAGVRLGFAVTSPGLGALLRDAFGPWAVPGPTLAVGAAALADQAWLRDQKVQLHRAATELDRVLQEAGFSLVGGTRLFRLASHAAAEVWFERLAQAGIWVRKFGHDPRILRFGIPPEQEFLRLRQALKPK